MKLGKTSTNAVIIGCLSWIFCQTGYSAYKEISTSGNVVQASHDSQMVKRTSIESPDFNIPAPQKSSDLWNKISESTKYNSIGSTESTPKQTFQSHEIKELRDELKNIKIEMTQLRTELQALQIQSLPGERILAKN